MWFVVGFAILAAATVVARRLLATLLPEWAREAAITTLAIAFIAWQGWAIYNEIGDTIQDGVNFGALLVAFFAANNINNEIFDRIENRFGTLADAVKDEEL